MADGGKVIIKIDGDDSGFRKTTESLGKVGKAALKGIAVGGAAVTAAIVGIGKSAISAYADYEQLVGGVETLFKDSSATVQSYANEAYKTAGLSANRYMETVTSFSASLLQSLKGDTEKAAAYADMAVTDMSDNANKMGTDMGLLQNAYQGFAKENYTMLDNLKLGYGGTKTEMQRLVRDAAKLDKSINANSLSFGNVVKAIHAVQTEMGITGTTAKEAATTIQGSLAMTKSAWENLMTGLTDPSQDLDKLVDNVFNSLMTLGKNLMPRVKNVLSGTTKLITAFVPELVKVTTGIIPELLPVVVDGVIQLGTAIVQSIPIILPQLLSAGKQIFEGLMDGLMEASPMLGKFISVLTPLIAEFMALSAAIKIVTVAQQALNLAQSMSPIALFAIGITALTTAFIAGTLAQADYISKHDELYVKINEMSEATDALIQKNNDAVVSFENAKKTYEDTTANIEAETYANQQLADELFNLADQENLTAAEKQRMSTIVDILNQSIDGLNLQLNNETGQLNLTKDAVKELIKKKFELAEANAAAAAYEEALKEQYSINMQLAAAEEQLAEVQAYKQALLESNTYGTKMSTAELINHISALKNTSGQEEYLLVSIENLNGALSENERMLQSAGEVLGVQFPQKASQSEQALGNLASGTQQAFDALIQKSKQTGENAGQDLAEGIGSKEGDVSNASSSLGNASITPVQESAEKTYSLGEDFGQGYANGINSKTETVRSAAANLGAVASSALQDAQKSNSPSKITKGLGKDFVDGYVLGIESKVPQTSKAAVKLAKISIKAVAEEIKNIGENVKNIISDLTKDTRTEVQKVIDEINEPLLESERKYNEESERLKDSKKESDKKYLESLKQTADEERKIYDALIRDMKNYREALTDYFSQTADGAINAIQKIIDKQKSLAGSLKNYSSLTSEITEKNFFGDEITKKGLTDFKERASRIELLGTRLQTLQNRGINKDLYEDILGSSVEEMFLTTNLLINLSDADFKQYNQDYAEYLKTTERLGKQAYQNEAETLTESVMTEFSKTPEEFFQLGEESSKQFGEGFLEELKNVMHTVTAEINAALSGMFTGSTQLALTGAGGNTYSSTYYIQPSYGESTHDQLKAIEAQETLKRMRGGY